MVGTAIWKLPACVCAFLIAGSALLFAAQTAAQVAGRTPASNDGSGAFATGKYRNVFAESGHSRKEISKKIESAYRQLFRGDPQTQAIFFAAGKNANGALAYITDWNNHDVRTEGMSYGMMIAVQLNKKKEFDALWNWAKTYMYISDPKHPSHGYFSWSCKTDGTPNEGTAAPGGSLVESGPPRPGRVLCAVESGMVDRLRRSRA